MAEKTVLNPKSKPSDVETCESSACTAMVPRRPCPKSNNSTRQGPALNSCNSSNSRNKRRRRNEQQQNLRISSPPKLRCVVCSSTDSSRPSYKCPKCRALYCSMTCCKEHKKSCSGTPASTNFQNLGARSSPGLQSLPSWKTFQFRSSDESDDDDSIGDGWKLDEEMKRAVEQSEWLHKELSDGGLRDIIAYVVSQSSTPRRSGQNRNALELAQQRFPHFKVFLDKLLVVAGILNREHQHNLNGVDGNGEISFEEESLEEWLKRDWSGDTVPPQLSLKPVIRKIPFFEAVDFSTDSSASSEEEDADSEISSHETSPSFSGESISDDDVTDNETQ